MKCKCTVGYLFLQSDESGYLTKFAPCEPWRGHVPNAVGGRVTPFPLQYPHFMSVCRQFVILLFSFAYQRVARFFHTAGVTKRTNQPNGPWNDSCQEVWFVHAFVFTTVCTVQVQRQYSVVMNKQYFIFYFLFLFKNWMTESMTHVPVQKYLAVLMYVEWRNSSIQTSTSLHPHHAILDFLQPVTYLHIGGQGSTYCTVCAAGTCLEFLLKVTTALKVLYKYCAQKSPTDKSDLRLINEKLMYCA